MRGVSLVWLLVIALVLPGCSVDGQARSWARQAVEQDWQANYLVTFHQQDGDLVMAVRERNQNGALFLDVTGPNDLMLNLEFNEGFSVDLNQGQLSWQQQHQAPPYYSLGSLAATLTATDKIEDRDGWAHVGGYQLQLSQGRPELVKFLGQWTLTVEGYSWD